MSLPFPEYWPTPSPTVAFRERRRRWAERFSGNAVLAAGLSRPRNFHASRFPFRAESHFLYFVGRHLEGALLVLREGQPTLYLEPPHPDEALWSGPTPSLEQLERELELPVRPHAELELDESYATLPPPDAESAFWLSEWCGRELEPASGALLEGADAALADAIIELRLVHDEWAVAQLRQAAQVTGWAHEAGLRGTRAGRREATVRGLMEGVIVGCGMSTSYNSIVTVHGEVLHAERHDGVMRAGELLLCDVGAETPEGWAGDVTRTWPVAAQFSESQRVMYELVLETQRAAIAAVAPGVRYRDVHRVAAATLVRGLTRLGVLRGDPEELYERGAAALFFPHGVGHLLGLDVHDMEGLGDRAGYAPGRQRSVAPGDRYLRCDRDLQPGMVVTIEPGFYQRDGLLAGAGALRDVIVEAELARFADVRGVRIEDDVLVVPTGSEVLTEHLPKDVAELEARRRAG